MKSYPFKKIDAFTKGQSPGNPAACIYLDGYDDISQQEMQLIASEMKGYVNEVVYLFQLETGIFLKYYSSECEVDFCGHGTIAAMYDLIVNSADMLDKDIIPIKVKDETLEVNNRIKELDCVYIMAPQPQFNSLNLSKHEIASALGIGLEGIDRNLDPALINAGLNSLMVPIADLRLCLDIFPDQIGLKSFCITNGLDTITVFTPDVADKTNQYRTRVFAPRYGYLEDPATGSGNSALGYYLLSKGLWGGGPLNIEQNSSYDCPNIIKLDTVQKDGKPRVIFGGAAVVKVEGQYLLASS
jgi:PhzF family phenazine biosynthesis protein